MRFITQRCSRRLGCCLAALQILGGCGLLAADVAVGLLEPMPTGGGAGLFGLGLVCGSLLALAGAAGCCDSADCRLRLLRLACHAAALLMSLPCGLLLAPAVFPDSAGLAATAAGYCGFLRLPQPTATGPEGWMMRNATVVDEQPPLTSQPQPQPVRTGDIDAAASAGADAERSRRMGLAVALAALTVGGLATALQLIRLFCGSGGDGDGDSSDGDHRRRSGRSASRTKTLLDGGGCCCCCVGQRPGVACRGGSVGSTAPIL